MQICCIVYTVHSQTILLSIVSCITGLDAMKIEPSYIESYKFESWTHKMCVIVTLVLYIFSEINLFVFT